MSQVMARLARPELRWDWRIPVAGDAQRTGVLGEATGHVLGERRVGHGVDGRGLKEADPAAEHESVRACGEGVVEAQLLHGEVRRERQRGVGRRHGVHRSGSEGGKSWLLQ